MGPDSEASKGGGRLEGYANDVGVQFELMNTRVSDIEGRLTRQSELLESIGKITAETMPMLRAVHSRLGLSLGADQPSFSGVAPPLKAPGSPIPRSRSPTLSNEDRIQDGGLPVFEKSKPASKRPHKHRRHRDQPRVPAAVATNQLPADASLAQRLAGGSMQLARSGSRADDYLLEA